MRGPMTHPDADVLAEFRAGLIAGRRGAAIAAHLAGCDRCSATDRELAEISVLLATVPAPAMPENVARRLDAVLAAEADKEIHPERTGVASTPEPSEPGPPRPRDRGFRLLRLRVLAPAAAVVALAAGGYGLSQIGGGPGTHAASSSAGRAATPPTGPVGPAASPFSGGASARRAMGPAEAAYPVATSGVNLTPARLTQQLEAVLRAPSGSVQAVPDRTRGCVQNVAGRATPVRVVSARYEGHPATVIVTRDGQGYLARVEGPGCSATRRDLLDSAILPPGI